MPSDLVRSATPEDTHNDLLLSRSDLDLTWPEVKFRNWPFKVKTYIFRNGSTRRTRWCHFNRHISHIKKLLMKNHLRENHNLCIWWPLEPKLLTLGQIWWKTSPEHEESFRMLFEFSLAIILLEITAIVCETIVIFSKADPCRPLVTSILTWPENDLCKNLRSCRGLSNVVYRLSLNSVFFISDLGWGL